MTQMVDHIFRRVKSHPNAQQEADQEDNMSADTASVNGEVENTQEAAVPSDPTADNTDYQQQIIVEANMARTEMDKKLPSSGKHKDNYEEFLNDTANVFQEEKIKEQDSEQSHQQPHAEASTLQVHGNNEVDDG